MYRFAKARNVLQQMLTMSQPNRAMHLCSFCNFYHPKTPKVFYLPEIQHGSINRYSSTITQSQLQTIKKAAKKTKRSRKKYAELLEVTNTANNTKAFVKSLTPKQIDTLVDESSISLDKLDFTKRKKKHTVLNVVEDHFEENLYKAKNLAYDAELAEIEVPDTIEECITEVETKPPSVDEPPPANEPLMDVEPLMEIEPKTKRKKKGTSKKSLKENSQEKSDRTKEEAEAEVTKKKKRKQSTKKGTKTKVAKKEATSHASRQNRGNLLGETLVSYVDVCVNLNQVENAFTVLTRGTFLGTAPKSIAHFSVAYNIAMKKYAEQGKYRMVQALLKNMVDAQIPPVEQTYAAIFECFGRMKMRDQLKDQIQMYINDMKSVNMDLDTMFEKAHFANNDLEFVLRAIHLVEPDYQIKRQKPIISYNNTLLSKVTCDNNAPVSPAEGLMSLEEMQNKVKNQMQNEISGTMEIKSVEKMNANIKKMKVARERVEKLEKHYRQIAEKSFEKRLLYLKNKESFINKTAPVYLYPYLVVLDKSFYIDAIMKEVKQMVQGSQGYSLSLGHLQIYLGEYIFKRYEMSVKKRKHILDKLLNIHSQYCDWYLNRTNGNNGRAQWEMLLHESHKKCVEIDGAVPQWPTVILSKVGRFLYDIILTDLKINQSLVPMRSVNLVPSFYVIYKNKSEAYLKQEVKPHTSLAKLYRDSRPEKLLFDTNLLPSLCPPRPWLSINSGGYLCTKTNIMRIPSRSNECFEVLHKVPLRQLYPALDCLNQLGSIPWKVNKNILNVAVELFQRGGNAKLDVPELPDSLPLVPPIGQDPTDEEKLAHFKARMARRKKKNEMMSLWCDTLYKLSMANHLKDEVFWLPHNMDFRGRVYPVPPHMTHVSSDLSRSMLVFAKKKPLGPKGLEWLKLHTINLTGFQKNESIKTRLAYAEQVLDKIIDSAQNPLTGEQWWTKSDEPWQTLASCMEVNAALQSPDPEKFLSGFPIHQDGSCNGLQHYAALGRDLAGAKSVNLQASEKPQDVYSAVAALVEEKRKHDAEMGLPVAKVLENFIKRKVIKQTVMTTVYGVTKYGARLQIAKQLRDIENFPQDHLWMASSYLATSTFMSLRSMFNSARQIQDWFTECAKYISSDREETVHWVTPMGLPIAQPYMKQAKSKNQSSNSTAILTTEYYEKPNVMKQKNAFPPNFVHSLDSSHMMLTSLHCENVGITFISVHDCFWTHCNTAEVMSKVCREQFVSLHSQPILENLSQYFIEKYASSKHQDTRALHLFTQVPQKGDFDLNDVLSSVYFFS